MDVTSVDVTSVDLTIRQAIGGNVEAIAAIRKLADTTDVAIVIVVAALLERDPDRLICADSLAEMGRDRQIVEIARAHLASNSELVDALARDHLVDHPDSLVVAWVASESVGEVRGKSPL
jgi:lactate dehydrogenase-like 2-hydroxyacid dehydrogenase